MIVRDLLLSTFVRFVREYGNFLNLYYCLLSFVILFIIIVVVVVIIIIIIIIIIITIIITIIGYIKNLLN